MSVAGINGTANYPVYTPGKATGKVSNNNFSQQINHAKAGNVHTFADTVKQTTGSDSVSRTEAYKDYPESVKLIVFICQSTIRLAKSRKCTLIMLNKPVLM